MSKIQERRKAAQQEIQEHKAKKNKYIIAAVFWFLSSLYIYSNDAGFSDVYSLKPFIYFIVGPVLASILFGNIMFFLQKIIERGVIAFLGNNSQNLVLPCYIFHFLLCTSWNVYSNIQVRRTTSNSNLIILLFYYCCMILKCLF